YLGEFAHDLPLFRAGYAGNIQPAIRAEQVLRLHDPSRLRLAIVEQRADHRAGEKNRASVHHHSPRMSIKGMSSSNSSAGVASLCRGEPLPPRPALIPSAAFRKSDTWMLMYGVPFLDFFSHAASLRSCPFCTSVP